MRNKVAKSSSQELNKLKQQMKPILSVKNFEETTQYVTVRSHLGQGNFPRPREIAILNPREIP